MSNTELINLHNSNTPRSKVSWLSASEGSSSSSSPSSGSLRLSSTSSRRKSEQVSFYLAREHCVLIATIQTQRQVVFCCYLAGSLQIVFHAIPGGRIKLILLHFLGFLSTGSLQSLSNPFLLPVHFLPTSLTTTRIQIGPVSPNKVSLVPVLVYLG